MIQFFRPHGEADLVPENDDHDVLHYISDSEDLEPINLSECFRLFGVTEKNPSPQQLARSSFGSSFQSLSAPSEKNPEPQPLARFSTENSFQSSSAPFSRRTFFQGSSQMNPSSSSNV